MRAGPKNERRANASPVLNVLREPELLHHQQKDRLDGLQTHPRESALRAQGVGGATLDNLID